MEDDEKYLRDLKSECPMLTHTMSESTEPYIMIDSTDQAVEELRRRMLEVAAATARAAVAARK